LFCFPCSCGCWKSKMDLTKLNSRYSFCGLICSLLFLSVSLSLLSLFLWYLDLNCMLQLKPSASSLTSF
jgi:hypothetical protein